LAAERVSGLVESHYALLVVAQYTTGLHTCDHPLQGLVEVGAHDAPATTPGREDGGLVADVRQVRAGKAAGLLRDEAKVHIPQWLVPRVHSEHPLAALHIGRAHEDLAVKAPWAQQGGVELLEQVRRGDHNQAPARG